MFETVLALTSKFFSGRRLFDVGSQTDCASQALKTGPARTPRVVPRNRENEIARQGMFGSQKWTKTQSSPRHVKLAMKASLLLPCPPPPLHPWLWPTKLGVRVHLDFAGSFLGRMFFIVVDWHSKWPQVIEIAITTALKTIQLLCHMFATCRLPKCPQFQFR